MGKKIDHIGETNIAKNGMKMTIIAYKNNKDIDIQFEDGTIVYNKIYANFKNGNIANPTLRATMRIGETNVAKNGMKITIIAYRDAHDIDIQFEDGTIVYNKQYAFFKIGKIKHPDTKIIKNRVGETNIAKNGMKMTIIAYRGCNDIDIQFEDNAIVYNKAYHCFKNGTIKHPNVNIRHNNSVIKHINETRTMNCGLKATIIKYHNCNNIDIQFEDGTIVYNKKYIKFQKGIIKHPNINVNNVKAITKHVGETRMMNCGIKATIIKYYNYHNIDVQFENGTIVRNKTYDSFKKGKIAKPITKHIGETRMMRCGLEATVIECHNFENISVQFEDNTIVYNKAYASFKKGMIKHPNINTHIIKSIAKHINETHTMNCGLKATIIKYHTAENVDVQFENNMIIYNKTYGCFKRGSIGIPKIINTIKLKEFAYKLNDDWYYICSHPTWMEDKILSVKEIYAYQPN